ncbi:kunitz-type protease inhibitor 1-like [Anoplopoma fimbria]|uniref:kunitz-type protease inhibitor 1-like n=1 Tax=Anoplopoma fimbria TaxID=229290 RepID=UPI0023EC268C|nr:kunitz-type protease inhibitor 1-like [Anoplopoma fimbria]
MGRKHRFDPLSPHLSDVTLSPAADCSGTFRSGQDNFVLDAEDAVKEGAALLATAHVRSVEACRSACCADPRCNLALLEPRGPDADAAAERECVLFDCVHRNRFVCRFVNQAGYRSYIRMSVFQRYLQGPQRPGIEAPPLAIPNRDVIVQPNQVVTLSGIQSLALGDAHIAHYHWTSRNSSIQMESTDLPDQVRLSNLPPGSFVLQLTVTDSNGRQSKAADVTVLVLSPEMTSCVCEKFVFGGCKANKNNFLSEDQCLSACKGVTGCCLDRSLECDGVKRCRDGADAGALTQTADSSSSSSSSVNQTFHRLLDVDVNQRKARCAEPPSPGPCRASFTRWFYDPLNRKCARFTYGGCDGSENNFEEEDQCSNFCKGVTERNVFFKGMFDRFEGEDESDSDDSGNIALAVCLSVAILALLAVLSYCFLKARKERSHRPVASGPAHVTLSEQESMVYNPTTKPV